MLTEAEEARVARYAERYNSYGSHALNLKEMVEFDRLIRRTPWQYEHATNSYVKKKVKDEQ